MKRYFYFAILVMLIAVPMTFTSCDDDDDYLYYGQGFNLDQAVDDYLDFYGEFGTDENTTKQWFNQHYYGYGGSDYYYNQDWSDFYNSLLKIYKQYQQQMADYLCTSAWQGRMKVTYSNSDGSKGQYTCTVEYDFDRSSTTATTGRGIEKRVNFSDGSADSQAAFTWEVDGYGNIIFTFDDNFQMVLYYSDLSYLNDKQFEGTISSNTQGYNEYYNVVLQHVTYAKPNVLRSQALSSDNGVTFKGLNTAKRGSYDAMLMKTRVNGHR